MRVAYAMDERDWAAMADLMVEDIAADFGTGEVRGRDQVIDFIRSFLDGCGTTQHLLGNILVDVTGDTATSQSYVCDMHLGRDTASDHTFRTLGCYHDTWIDIDSQWKLVNRRKDNRATLGSMDVFSLSP